MKPITTLEEMKSIQLEIMDKIHSFCETNNINYFLSHGSLIGAIRHQGFIPWDDDIDLFMPRSDYDQFCALFPSVQKALGLEIVNSYSPKYYGRPMSKIIDSRTVLTEPNYLKDDEIGVNIDIWPLDGVPVDEREYEKHLHKIQMLQKMLYARIVKYDACKTLLQKTAHLCLLLSSPRKTVNRIIELQKKYRFEDGIYVSCYVDPYKKRFKKEWFSDRALVSFEDRKYYIPKEADKVLTELYGDYMKLPPVEQQQPHHITNAFWK